MALPLRGLQRIIAWVALTLASTGCAYKMASPLPTYDVRSFGAKGDGVSKDTRAIQAALDAAVDSGGGTVRISAGQYVCGSLFFRSHYTTLQIDTSATILGSEDRDDYPITKNRWEGIERDAHASLINASGLRHIAITGGGTIDGRGNMWWKLQRKKQLEHPRPRLVQLIKCEDVRIDRVKLANSPSWTLHPLYCHDVDIDTVTITAPPNSPNTDGIDPDSCTDVRIRNCRIDCGDDCVAIKSGKDEDGRRVGRPSKNITVENCMMLHGHGGVVIGSEMSGGVRNVRVIDCNFIGTDRGVRIKTQRGRGGTVENILYRNIQMKSVGDAINIDMYYSGRADTRPHKFDVTTPTFRGIRIENVTAEGSKTAGHINGLPESPIRDLVFKDVTIQAAKGLQGHDVADSDFRGLKVVAREGAGVKVEHVERLMSR